VQLPDGTELAGLAIADGQARGGVLGHGFENDRLIDLLVGRCIEQHVEVGVLVAVRLVLPVDARRKPHHEALLHTELIRGEDFHVHEIDGVGGQRFESWIARERLEHRRQSGLVRLGVRRRGPHRYRRCE
jgi:hypothetical protein